MLLTAVFGHLGLRRRGSTAIDVDQLLAILAAPGGETLARALALAIGGVLEAAVAFTDPSFVVLGGPWSWASSFAAALAAVVGDSLGDLPVVPPQVHDNPPLAGARAAAVEGLRADIIRRSKAG
jgi:predicted NBD/HSP70 family sugar kinase